MLLKRILTVLVVACAAPFALAGPAASSDSTRATEAGVREANRIASSETITPQDVADIATALGNSQYAVLWEDSGLRHVEFGAGLLRLGEGLGIYYQAGEQLPRGVYWNVSDATVWLGAGDGKAEVEIPANGLVVVGQAQDGAQQPIAFAAGDCVTCGAGFYACCCRNGGGSSSTCNCIAAGGASNCNNGNPCTSGGPGATSCSLPWSRASLAVIDITDGGGIEVEP